MLKLTIIKTDEYANYILEDKDGKKYDVNISFMGIKKPAIGTIIYIDESTLKENVSLNYGLVRKDKLRNEKELITLISGDEKIYLQRYYG